MRIGVTMSAIVVTAGIVFLFCRGRQVIGIDFFWELYSEDWFIIPVLAVAFGLGVSLFRDLTRAIDNITQLLHWLIKLLLPLVLAIWTLLLVTFEAYTSRRTVALASEIWQVVQDEQLYIPIHHQVLNWGMKTAIDFPVQPEDQPHFKFLKFK